MLSMKLDLDNFELPPLDERDAAERETFVPTAPVGAKPPKTMKLWHETVAAMMLADPARTQRSIAGELKVTEAWLSTMVNSDMFRAYLSGLKDGLITGPAIASLKERVEGIASMALTRVETLIPYMQPKEAIDAADKLLHRAGYAPKTGAPAGPAGGNTQNNYITVTADVLREARNVMHQPVTINQVPDAPATPALTIQTGG